MAKMWITEFQRPSSPGGAPLPATNLGAVVAEQAFEFTTTTPSAALNPGTEMVRILADANCCIKYGAGSDPTATINNLPLTAGVPEYFEVPAGTARKIAAVTR